LAWDKPGERPPLFEKAAHAVTEGGEILFRNRGQDITVTPQGELAGEVFLDGHRLIELISGQIDDRKPAAGQDAGNSVVAELVTSGSG
jgi:hypothetical protein